MAEEGGLFDVGGGLRIDMAARTHTCILKRYSQTCKDQCAPGSEHMLCAGFHRLFVSMTKGAAVA